MNHLDQQKQNRSRFAKLAFAALLAVVVIGAAVVAAIGDISLMTKSVTLDKRNGHRPVTQYQASDNPAGSKTSPSPSIAASFNLSSSTTMFNESNFAQIKFLEGRWKGVGPDGKEFFDEYILAEPNLLRSIRHADATFSKATDESTVALKDGVITSTWGEFTWRATSMSASKVCFEPVNAPSSFCWELVAPDTATVTQRWTSSDGKEQSFVLTLNRVKL